MAHHNATPWDAELLAQLQSDPYKSMPQGTTSDWIDGATGNPVFYTTDKEGNPLPLPDGVVLDEKGTKADDAICDLLNAETVSGSPITITARDVRSILFASGAWLKIVIAANQARANASMDIDTLTVAVLCQTLYDLSNSDGIIDMADPPTNAAVQAALQGLQAGKIVTADDIKNLLAYATSPDVPWWNHVKAPGPFNRHDLQRARS